MLIKDINLIKKVLDNHGVIAFPTETVMGLGVYFDDKVAYDRLNTIKHRPEDKPYTLMLGDINDISKYAYISHRDFLLIKRFMPGSITILLHAKDNVPSYVTHNTGVIGIRVPDNEIICSIIKGVGKPLLVPSANRSGEKPCLTYLEVIETFKDEIEYVYPSDSLKNLPSTIVDLTNKDIKILREGPITQNQIERSLANMKISLGSDHGGLEYKNEIAKHLKEKGYEVIDCGTFTSDSCHYPIFGKEAALKVASGECDFGIVVCTSGEGICIAANKVKGIRCGLGYNDEVSRLMRQHNDANMIAFGQKFMSLEDVLRRVDIFLSTDFEGGRHQTRVELIKDIEK